MAEPPPIQWCPDGCGKAVRLCETVSGTHELIAFESCADGAWAWDEQAEWMHRPEQGGWFQLHICLGDTTLPEESLF